jgi:hypothetical protein
MLLLDHASTDARPGVVLAARRRRLGVLASVLHWHLQTTRKPSTRYCWRGVVRPVGHRRVGRRSDSDTGYVTSVRLRQKRRAGGLAET